MDPNSGFAGPLGRDRWKEKEIRLRGNMYVVGLTDGRTAQFRHMGEKKS